MLENDTKGGPEKGSWPSVCMWWVFLVSFPVLFSSFLPFAPLCFLTHSVLPTSTSLPLIFSSPVLSSLHPLFLHSPLIHFRLSSSSRVSFKAIKVTHTYKSNLYAKEPREWDFIFFRNLAVKRIAISHLHLVAFYSLPFGDAAPSWLDRPKCLMVIWQSMSGHLRRHCLSWSALPTACWNKRFKNIYIYILPHNAQKNMQSWSNAHYQTCLLNLQFKD